MKAELDKMEATGKKDAAAKQWFQANYMSKMMEAMGPLMSLGATCGQDKNFMAAMEGLKFGEK
jgi:hypothetical protein